MFKINAAIELVSSASSSSRSTLYVPEYGYVLNFDTASQVDNLMFNPEDGEIEFNVSGPDGTWGFCNVTIPRALLYTPENEWHVLMDDIEIEYVALANDTATVISFGYLHSEHHIIIRAATILPAGFDYTMLIVIGALAGVVIVVMLLIFLKKGRSK